MKRSKKRPQTLPPNAFEERKKESLTIPLRRVSHGKLTFVYLHADEDKQGISSLLRLVMSKINKKALYLPIGTKKKRA